MKAIKQFVNEAIFPIIAEISRNDMPQVRGKNIPEILNMFDDNNISYKEGMLKIGELKPIQADFIPSKLDSMIDNIKLGTFKPKPIFISKDGFILDGHHRFLAFKKLYDDNKTMEVIRVDLPKWEALYVFSDEAESLNTDEGVIKESPDFVKISKYDTSYYDSDAFAFGIWKNKAWISNNKEIHSAIALKYNDVNGVPSNRKGFDFPGRIWTKKKLISFWEYPKNSSEMKKVITMVEKESKIKMWNSQWKIEVVKGEEWNLMGDGESEIIPIMSYHKSGEQKNKELSHQKSPLLKKKKIVPSGVGSKKYGKEKPLSYKYKLQKGLGDGVIKENPDGIEDADTDYQDSDAFAFGIWKNKAWISNNRETHLKISFNYDVEGIPLSRRHFDFPGRIWTKKKIISFWEYPKNSSEMKKVITMVEKESKIKMWNSQWKIEVIGSGEPGDMFWTDGAKIISLLSYTGSDEQKNKGKSHQKSPALKKKKSVPSGVGSKKYGKEKPLSYRYKLRKGLGDGIEQKTILPEDVSAKNIVVFPGRFQPFHLGHYDVYKKLVKQFGKDNVYISTTNIVNPEKSPFNFNDKKIIISKLFDISSSKIILVDNPYKWSEYKNLGDDTKDILIIGVGEKDINNRLRGKYYEEYDEVNNKLPFSKKGYFYKVPQLQLKIAGTTISGSIIRKIFKGNNEKVKKGLFKKLYGKLDKKIYNLLDKKITESIILSTEVIEEFLINNNLKIIIESSLGSKSSVDDGPATFYKTPMAYKKGKLNTHQKSMEGVIEQLGWQVIDWIAGDKDEYVSQRYRYNLVGDVSFGDVGNRDTEYPDPILKYKNHLKKIAGSVGYSVVNWLLGDTDEENMIDDLKKDMALQEPLVQDVSGTAILKEALLQEGGVMGHLNHPFDDWNLTFGDLQNIIDIALEGKLELVQEKTDGQQLSISWKDGKLIAARNKGQLKNFGKYALDKSGVSQMFSGRGDIHDAFTYAMNDLESALINLSEKDKQGIFEEGKNFMSLEIIFPATQNVIPYGLSLLLFHGIIEYDEQGNQVGQNKTLANKLSKMIKNINADVQKTFTISDVPIQTLPKVNDFSKQKSKFTTKLNKLKNKYKLKGTDPVTLYHQNWWADFISKQANIFKYGISNEILINLVKRWAFGDKSYNVNQMKKIDNESFKDWAIKYDKNEHKKQLKENLEPFELLFLELGATILKNLKSLLVLNPNKAVQTLKTNIEKEIKAIEGTTDVSKIEKMKVQLNRLEAIGGMDMIVPSEGIVFEFKGKLMKFTGSFASVNQLMGILKFNR